MSRPSDCVRTSAPKQVRRPSDAVGLVRALLADPLPPAGEIVIGLDAAHRLTGVALRPDSVDRPVDAEQLVGLAAELDAVALVLVSFLTDECEFGLETDIEGFVALARACLAQHVLLFDHLMLAGTRWRSTWDTVARATGDPAA